MYAVKISSSRGGGGGGGDLILLKTMKIDLLHFGKELFTYSNIMGGVLYHINGILSNYMNIQFDN